MSVASTSRMVYGGAAMLKGEIAVNKVFVSCSVFFEAGWKNIDNTKRLSEQGGGPRCLGVDGDTLYLFSYEHLEI